MHLNKRETGAVLAGLRSWQRLMVDRHGTPAEIGDIASANSTEEPLGIAEIDDLFNRIWSLAWPTVNPPPRTSRAMPEA